MSSTPAGSTTAASSPSGSLNVTLVSIPSPKSPLSPIRSFPRNDSPSTRLAPVSPPTTNSEKSITNATEKDIHANFDNDTNSNINFNAAMNEDSSNRNPINNNTQPNKNKRNNNNNNMKINNANMRQNRRVNFPSTPNAHSPSSYHALPPSHANNRNWGNHRGRFNKHPPSRPGQQLYNPNNPFNRNMFHNFIPPIFPNQPQRPLAFVGQASNNQGGQQGKGKKGKKSKGKAKFRHNNGNQNIGNNRQTTASHPLATSPNDSHPNENNSQQRLSPTTSSEQRSLRSTSSPPELELPKGLPNVNSEKVFPRLTPPTSAPADGDVEKMKRQQLTPHSGDEASPTSAEGDLSQPFVPQYPNQDRRSSPSSPFPSSSSSNNAANQGQHWYPMHCNCDIVTEFFYLIDQVQAPRFWGGVSLKEALMGEQKVDSPFFHSGSPPCSYPRSRRLGRILDVDADGVTAIIRDLGPSLKHGRFQPGRSEEYDEKVENNPFLHHVSCSSRNFVFPHCSFGGWNIGQIVQYQMMPVFPASPCPFRAYNVVPLNFYDFGFGLTSSAFAWPFSRDPSVFAKFASPPPDPSLHLGSGFLIHPQPSVAGIFNS